MIRRKSTLDHAQRAKRTKFIQIFTILDLCLQLTSDDRIIIRNQIKNGDDELSQRIYKCKRDKNYHGLQIHLRKIIKDIKDNDKFGLGISKRSNKSKQPISAKITKNLNDSSLYNSAHNSLISTPGVDKEKQYPVVQLRKIDMERHINNQNNIEKQEMNQKQYYEGISRGKTARDVVPAFPKPPPLLNSKKLFANELPFDQNNIKQLLRTKMLQKQITKVLPQLPTTISCELANQRIPYRQNLMHDESRNQKPQRKTYTNQLLTKNKQNKLHSDFLYGQFHKRIKKVIQDAH